MKESYNRTLMIPAEELPKATVKIIISEYVKWENEGGEIEREYTGLVSWDIITGGDEAKAIEAVLDRTDIDENHEYLVLYFNDLTTITFRNSHTTMFIR